MKIPIIFSIFLVGCFVDSKPANNLDGNYKSDTAIDTIGPGMNSQDLMKIKKDSIEFYQVRQQVGVRTITFSGGKYEIKNDSISFRYSSYARVEIVETGKIFLDTINYALDANGFKVTTRLILENNGIQIEYIGEKSNHFVKFRKVDELSI